MELLKGAGLPSSEVVLWREVKYKFLKTAACMRGR